jgi:hypothetical protein
LAILAILARDILVLLSPSAATSASACPQIPTWFAEQRRSEISLAKIAKTAKEESETSEFLSEFRNFRILIFLGAFASWRE